MTEFLNVRGKIAGGAAPNFWENRLSYVDHDFFFNQFATVCRHGDLI